MSEKHFPIQDNSINGYHETKKHTDLMFPYNVYPCTIPDDFPSVSLHWQDTMEIIYIKKGRGTAQADLSVFDVQAGDIILAPPGHLHGLRHIHGIRMEYENIIFDMTFLGSGVIDLCSQKYLIPLLRNELKLPVYISPKDACYEQISACLDNADMLCDRRPAGYELEVKADMMKLFSILFRMADPADQVHPVPANIDRLKSILIFIEENFQRPLTVEEAADVCGYSASHFMRWFRQVTGTSFIRYLNQFRLEKAFLELKNTDKTVLEISHETGFDNLSNFNRLFKKQFQMTPRELRPS